MKRFYLLIALLMTGATSIMAQSIKRVDSNFSDYVKLLNASGYQAYTFDISELKDSTYKITLEVKEYNSENKEPVEIKVLRTFKNRRMVKDFMWREIDEEEMKEIKEEAIDFDNGVFSISEKIIIGLYPENTDSIKNLLVNVENYGTSFCPLLLKKVHDEKYDKYFYIYSDRPFKVTDFKTNTFIPLVLYGSVWYDPIIEGCRFCGESEIDPEMTAEILKHIPNYYVIGVTFTPEE